MSTPKYNEEFKKIKFGFGKLFLVFKFLSISALKRTNP